MFLFTFWRNSKLQIKKSTIKFFNKFIKEFRGKNMDKRSLVNKYGSSKGQLRHSFGHSFPSHSALFILLLIDSSNASITLRHNYIRIGSNLRPYQIPGHFQRSKHFFLGLIASVISIYCFCVLFVF